MLTCAVKPLYLGRCV